MQRINWNWTTNLVLQLHWFMSLLFHSAPVQNMDQATLQFFIHLFIFLNYLTLCLNLSFRDHAVGLCDVIIQIWIITKWAKLVFFFFFFSLFFAFVPCVGVSRQVNLFSSSRNKNPFNDAALNVSVGDFARLTNAGAVERQMLALLHQAGAESTHHVIYCLDHVHGAIHHLQDTEHQHLNWQRRSCTLPRRRTFSTAREAHFQNDHSNTI